MGMTRSKAPTLEMVAHHAGVSRATVSRVVNGAATVDKQMVEVVQRSIDALNYVPNRAARSLARRRTQSIALVVPESAAKVFADPFFASVVQGIALELAPTDYTLNMIIESEAQAPKTRRYLLGGNVDGALVVSHHTGDHSWAELSDMLPVVFGGRPLVRSDSEHHFVDVDNLRGARIAVQYLIDRGRTHVATIAGPQDMPPGLDRLTGWAQVLAEAGLQPGPVAYGDFTADSGAAAMRTLLEGGEPIDAVFVANDQMALGAYPVLREAGRRIPDDVAVVGFDDSYFSASTDPPLTTVHQPLVEMGAEMARVLVNLIEGRPTETATVMDGTLVERGSA
ncbi:LacI family DNA-binding transcriptional regulator [Tessaracoccus antarcticus]|uniref:LacI family transcriptional regulator n=1 Tax=Tessaracoccus antarcticus TaxID=2479848 RepID=A0A3M0GBJ1_9ACTN|nr:LacI family DNA-binding transcriptional regulator [Tessaracoccus antarcticus]RMB61738.1 LacI family transcriptional regulator [Tessaracoccus antarcticus]